MLESVSVSLRYSPFTTLSVTTPLSGCTAESCSPNFATLPAVAILARCHHPSQQLYCRELLPLLRYSSRCRYPHLPPPPLSVVVLQRVALCYSSCCCSPRSPPPPLSVVVLQ